MAEAQPKKLLPAYLLLGDDHVKMDVAVAHMAKNTGADVDGYDSFDAKDLVLPQEAQSSEGDAPSTEAALFDHKPPDLSSLSAALNTLPLFSDKRMVLVKNLEAAFAGPTKGNKAKQPEQAGEPAKPKEERNATARKLVDLLVDYLKAPNQSTVLMLCAENLKVSSRLYKAVQALGKQAVIDCHSAKKAADRAVYIRNLAKNAGLELDFGAAQHLADLTGGNTTQIRSDLAKLREWAQAQGTAQITTEVVDNLVARTEPPTTWKFVDAVFSKNIPLALNLLLQVEVKNEASRYVSLLGACVYRLRDLVKLKGLQERGVLAPAELGRAVGKQDWQLKKELPILREFSLDRLRAALIAAADTDAQIKSGTDQEAAFDLWLFRLCA
jgi:DNA polymerase-3 subunit delta